MTIASGNPALDDPVVAAALDGSAWIELHVPRFAGRQSRYVVYKNFLRTVLQTFCRQVAPLAIVQARAKAVPSFAEKILRKRADYTAPMDGVAPDPLVRLTDLCGARVIAQTSAQVKAVCRLIKETFDIDWNNSDDASKRLRATEFGYRTMNYIVIPNPAKLAAAGIDVPVPPELLEPVRPESPLPVGLKAEIQVRTLLEHAYADIGHDLTYKTEVTVPDRIHRSFSAIAAILENADEGFERLVDAFNAFKSNYGAYHTREQVKEEIARLRVIQTHLPDDLSQAVRIARLALAIGDFEQAIEILTPFREHGHQGVQRSLGTALTKLHWDTPQQPEFREGVALLEAASRHKERDAELLCELAECWEHSGNADKAGDCFRQALAEDAAEPHSLCRYLEFQVKHTSNDMVVRLAEPMIRNAIARCRTHIEGRVNLAHAWSTLSVFLLLIGDPFGALDALAHLLDLCEHPDRNPKHRPCACGRSLKRLLKTLAHLHCIREKLEGFDWLERATLLGLAVRTRDTEALAELQARASRGDKAPAFKAGDRVVIVAGGCVAEVEPFMPPFRDVLAKGAAGQSFTLVSGGTAMGISGVAGDAAGRSNGTIFAVGYLPKPRLEALQQIGYKSAFDVLFPSAAADFTPLDPLQAWTDMISAGVDPARVKVIAYAGGAISRVECAMALGLGARVGVVLNKDLPQDRQFDDPAWTGHRNFLPLPMDAMTLHAFIRIDAVELSEADKERLEPAAKQAHEAYARSATPKEPSLRPWDDLDESLKLSNYQQVAYWENVLRDFGLGVRRLTDADSKHDPLDMDTAVGTDKVRQLAEMEHGRWNVERLGYGWRYAKEKDVPKHRSPYLIPWHAVPENIQKFDLDAIRGLPRRLREVGLELVAADTLGAEGM